MPNKVEEVPITVAGNILSELSEKIPNNIIALNELIKNAYDACSPSVDIKLDSESKKLIIRDYGSGMDIEGIEKLFHISSSEKQYGAVIAYGDTQRLTQGSKGLGFLSVFKFGEKVSWKTSKNGQIFEFEVDFESLRNEYNLPDHKLNIRITDQEFKGTQIVIDVDDYNLQSLKATLANESSRKKILNSFVSSKVSNEGIKIDKDFIINLTLDDNTYSSDVNLDISHQGKKAHQLFRIKYSSKGKKINYYKNNFYIAQPESSNSNLVSMPINKEVNFRSDVVSFIGEINRIFSTEDYSFVAVAAYRTLIEIVVNDILDNSKIGKTESLLQNYRKVIEEGKGLIDSSELDDADKRVLNSLRSTISSRDESESFLAFLNLSTHGGTRIITKVDVMKKTQEIKLLLGLLYISEANKNK